MDIHDASDIPECVELLTKQKATLRNARSFKGQRPRWTKSRDEVIMHFMLHRLAVRDQNTLPYMIQSSFIPPAYPPCISPLNSLKKAMVKDLLVETHHRSSYLLLRTVTPENRMTAVIAVVEDEEGDVVVLQLYNQDMARPDGDILPEGSVLVVKEPYLKIMSDGDYGIRVDHLSDIKFVPKYDKLVPSPWRKELPVTAVSKMSAHDWRVKGNDFFNMSKYYLAIECYSKALECSSTDDEAYIIRLNRTLAFLRTHQFDAALADVENVPTGHNASEKALLRKARALYHLQRFQECCDTLEVLRSEYPENNVAKEEFARAIRRLAEHESGKYSFRALHLEAAKHRPPYLDHATYVGPVTVKSTSSRGRGLFTTKAVKAGELLFCEKAFAYAFVDTANQTRVTQILINTETDAMSLGGQAELVPLIVQKLYKNASFIPTITDLHHGSCEPVTVSNADDMPVVDTFLVERIMSLNCFGCPISTRESHIRIMSGAANQGKTDRQFDTCGLWPLASYINHSCFSNARRSFIGDMMIVRAAQDLEPGTEIVFWYQSPFNSEPSKEQTDFRQWEFNCDCIMCQDVRVTSDVTLARRKRLRNDVLNHFQSPKALNEAEVEATLLMLAETYSRPASEVPRILLWDLYLDLSRAYAKHNQPKKAIDWALKALESLGYVIDGGCVSNMPLTVKKWGLMTDSHVECWMILARAYLAVGPELAAQAEDYARITYRICVGEDETFYETYGNYPAWRIDLLSRMK